MAKREAALPVKLSHPDKIFWPEEGFTKLDLANFYQQVFPVLQPFVDDRILTLERCPDGMRGGCFYQKEKPAGLPEDTRTIRIPNATGQREATNYILGGSLLTQLALVNLGCISVHASGSRGKTYPKPDWVCFDLDPNTGKFADAAKAGLVLKGALDELDLVSFPKTSGSRGLHVFVPIRVGPTAREVLNFAEVVAARLAAAHPKELTVEHSIAKRGDRVYLDAYRNGQAQTVVTPYSVRSKPHAPVSTPLAWSEVKPTLEPSQFNIGNFRKRLTKKDPWGDFFKSRQNLKAAIGQLKKL
jgi:bifunctional non-homologous end joining protein LigD